MRKSFMSFAFCSAALITASVSATSYTSRNDNVSSLGTAIETSVILQEFSDLRKGIGARISGSLSGFEWVPMHFRAGDTVEVRCWHSFLLGQRPLRLQSSLSTR